jgi:hypothetical protein
MPRKGRITVTRVRAGLIFLLTAAFLVGGAQASYALLPDGTEQSAVGTTGAQTSVNCPNPRMVGLPKKPKFTNATVRLRLINVTAGENYLIKAGDGEVYAGQMPDNKPVKVSFQLPDQGTKDRTLPITAIVASDQCANAPWKLEKKIRYKAVNTPAPAGAVPPAATPTPAPATAKPATPATPLPATKLPKLPKILNPASKLPPAGPALNIRAWMTPLDGGSRVDQLPPGPQLSRTERKADKAKSSSALMGLGISFLVLVVATAAGFLAFKRRDEVNLDAALGALPQHLEEGDPGLVNRSEEPATEPLAVEAAGVGLQAPPGEGEHAGENGEAVNGEHRAQVEAELQRMLNEAGVHAELEGILADARAEAARQGIRMDPDLMLQALCQEMNGSATLSDPARSELLTKFQEIIAEESQKVPQEAS